jgi:DegV family protein with EDD domain
LSSIAILTDSTAYLPPELTRAHQIQVIPLSIAWEGKTYRDGIDLTSAEFYPRLDRAARLPSTSQPPLQEFLDLFEDLDASYDGIVAPLISSGISGTVSTALSAAAEFTKIPVNIVDTHATAGGLALIVLATARCAEQGGSLEETVKVARDISNGLHTFFMVDTLKFLHMGGRIGGAQRFLGSALSIKPILCLDKAGKIDALESVRTRQKAMRRLAELLVDRAAGRAVHLSVYHANVPDQAGEFLNELSAQMNCVEALLFELSPVIGAHVGSGTIGVSIYAE